MLKCASGVSIHASVKDATKTGLFSALWWCFNPRICKRCDMAPDQNSRLAFCFNPRICKRCDVTYPYKYRVVTVSIHASVKDATHSKFDALININVSIHASVKDATWLAGNIVPGDSFNPRICKRCDHVQAYMCYPIPVSIHASVKDATSLYLLNYLYH